jgi:hypothetical protein
MEKIGKKIKKKKAGIRPWIVIGLIIGTLIFAFSVPKPMLEKDESGTWHIIWRGDLTALAEADPGSGATGFLEFFVINHTATPSEAYLENDSSTLESWCTANMPAHTPYATADNFNISIASEVSFNFLVKARWNKTHIWDIDHFDDSRARVKVTITSSNWADGEDISDVEGTLIVTQNNTADDFLWANVYWNAGDNNGYQLADDGTITITEISIEAKF